MKPATSTAPAAATTTLRTPSSSELAQYMPLVHQVVARFLRRLPRNVLREDLVAAGSFGLVDALRKAAEDRGPAFEWYARVRIRGAIVDELRSQDWLTRRARTKLTAERAAASPSSQPPSAAFVGFEDLPQDVQARGFADEGASSALDLAVARDESTALLAAIELLPAREKNIVRSYYFEGVPFKVLAAELGVSEPRISQLHARAMKLLKEAMVRTEEVAA